MKKVDPTDFWKKYKLLESTKTFKQSIKHPRVCRFCKKNEQKTTFNTVTHAVPELLGKNNFTSFDECDKCNFKFSGYESHLSKFFMPYLTMIGVKGKRKVPDFHSRTESGDENTRMIVKAENEKQRSIQISELSVYKIDEVSKTMSITFKLPPHKPLFVYKSLVKIGMSLLPKEKARKYSNTFKWLLDENSSADYFCQSFITVLKGVKFAEPFAEIYSAKRAISKYQFIPQLTLVIRFGNLVVQVFLPFSDNFMVDLQLKKPVLNIYPSFIYEKNSEKFIFKEIDFCSAESVSYDEKLQFTFESADLNIKKDT